MIYHLYVTQKYYLPFLCCKYHVVWRPKYRPNVLMEGVDNYYSNKPLVKYIKRRNPMTILKVDNITKKFGTLTALDRISFEMEQGEVLGFIGPNGAGKTTTIRILLGILKASSGNAVIFGKDVWNDAVEIHKNLAFVPGEVNLWPNLTGGEVIDLFIKLRGNNGRNRREELIRRFDLDPSKKCGTYSKGNRQKVALIAAFSTDADLYILDEPTTGLDPLMKQFFQECVNEVKKEGKSVLLSSHILSEVEKLCDRVCIIRKGEIIETGTLEELRHLTRTHIKVETRQPVPELESIDGIHNLQKAGKVYIFQADTDKIGKIIKYLGQFDITALESAPPTLEDLFLHHYQSDRGEDG
jgi:ABC-2 type transport system ATP-binding protein